MIKKTIACAAAFAFIAGFTVTGSAMADNGPADMMLQATVDAAKKAKPAIFPHKKHQDAGLECGACHHGKDADGKKTAYVADMKIAKCETCHNKAAGFPKEKKISTFKDASHKACKACHKAEKKGPTKCAGCHPKKK